MDTIKLTEDVERDKDGIACSCGGFADRVSCTQEEIKKYNCGRDFECCSRAFQCRVCKQRIVGSALAPEMSF